MSPKPQPYWNPDLQSAPFHNIQEFMPTKASRHQVHRQLRKVEFNVHEASITWLSQPLNALLTSGMKESIDARFVWEDVDADTFHGSWSTPTLEFHHHRPKREAGVRWYHMAHSHIYALAEKYSMDGLKALCVGRTQCSLARNPVQAEVVCALVDVLRFIWPQTTLGDAMCALVFRYILTNMSSMMSQPKLVELLEEIPEVSHALLLMIH
ncbi:hypothetical protein CT0861_03435 [Colletotrichum tofieldiae]|uniref:Uncharacterized protein n=1 Tax=Colletotrichum tofieldiae TaxID=708197 RepID=A0A166X9V9_9PEZI|nr:hypothetical protein CT0861_03435 [Colletotrichum tofieldiae]